MYIRQKIYNLSNLFSVSEKHHTPTFKPTHSYNNMSKSSVMSKAIQAIVICIIFSNFSFQKNLEIAKTGYVKGNAILQQQLTVIEEKKTEFLQG